MAPATLAPPGRIHFDAEPLRDRQYFNDDLLCEAAAFRRKTELIDRAPGYGADAVESGVERDLLPDRSPYGGVRAALETGGREVWRPRRTIDRNLPSAAMSLTTPLPCECTWPGATISAGQVVTPTRMRSVEANSLIFSTLPKPFCRDNT